MVLNVDGNDEVFGWHSRVEPKESSSREKVILLGCKKNSRRSRDPYKGYMVLPTSTLLETPSNETHNPTYQIVECLIGVIITCQCEHTFESSSCGILCLRFL